MPIGVVTDEEFNRELESLSNSKVVPSTSVHIGEVVDKPVSGLIVDKLSKGRASGDNNVPDSLRQIIGEDAVLNGRRSALGLAGMFGISPSSVSAYANGATSTKSYDSPSPSIISHISRSRERAIKRAQKTLNGSLSAITQDKLDYTDARDLAGIAKDMSVIIKNLEPEKVLPTNDGQPTTQFIVYAPQFRREESFEVINVTDQET